MKFKNWKLVSIEAIQPEEFYQLIQDNKSHIENTFPVTVANCSDLQKTKEFLRKNAQKQLKKEGYYFYIRNTETEKLIGYTCIKNVNLDILKCELAYFIDAQFEGKGIISRTIAQILTYCFKELNMNKVFICTSKINAGSQRIALKHGFQKEGVLRQEFKNGQGILEDIVYFGLLQTDYKPNEN